MAVALLATGFLYETASEAVDRRRFPPPGRLVEVDGKRLHIHCIGEGRPTVVLETGLGGMSAVWAWLQPEIARASRVCAYDRAGLGWSDAADGPRDARHVARQLHALLSAAGVEGPYVLVGHSLGALFARTYAHLYPHEVAGMVLLDPSHPDQLARFPREAVREQRRLFRAAHLAPLLARFGLIRLSGVLASQTRDLRPRQQAVVQSFLASPRHLAATAAEAAAWPETCAQVRAGGAHGDLRLLVISAGGVPDDVRPSWHAMHRDLAGASTRGEHRVLGSAGHVSMVVDRRHAHRVGRAIARLVALVRAGEAP